MAYGLVHNISLIESSSRRCWYCQLKSNWTDFLPRDSNMNAEQSTGYKFEYRLIFGQIHLT